MSLCFDRNEDRNWADAASFSRTPWGSNRDLVSVWGPEKTVKGFAPTATFPIKALPLSRFGVDSFCTSCGGFHKLGVPQNRWFIKFKGKIPSRNGWWLGGYPYDSGNLHVIFMSSRSFSHQKSVQSWPTLTCWPRPTSRASPGRGREAAPEKEIHQGTLGLGNSKPRSRDSTRLTTEEQKIGITVGATWGFLMVFGAATQATILRMIEENLTNINCIWGNSLGIATNQQFIWGLSRNYTCDHMCRLYGKEITHVSAFRDHRLLK